MIRECIKNLEFAIPRSIRFHFVCGIDKMNQRARVAFNQWPFPVSIHGEAWPLGEGIFKDDG